jgi:ABC-type transport system involved in cytochrome bd biosynthesis fused ATPase/permease subunit
LSLNSYDAFEYRSHVGFCFENPELVEGSLRDNVLMGRLDVKEERLRRLSDELGLESMLEAMPNNWDYQVQAAGKALPKKMKSKIMLLRAVIHAPALVLLDEPWQGLDEASQTQIKEFIRRHSSDCMMVVATNDSNFLSQCQQVVDLDRF